MTDKEAAEIVRRWFGTICGYWQLGPEKAAFERALDLLEREATHDFSRGGVWVDE